MYLNVERDGCLKNAPPYTNYKKHFLAANKAQRSKTKSITVIHHYIDNHHLKTGKALLAKPFAVIWFRS